MRWPVAADPLPTPGRAVRNRRGGAAPLATLACLLLAVTACTAQPPPPPQTPPATAAPSPSASPTPSPTPTSARERAIADSKQAYIEFVRALDQFAQAGGGDRIPEYVDRFLVPDGPARRYVGNEMKTVKSRKLRASGFGTLRDLRLLQADDIGKSPPEARWSACLDQSSVIITQAGKPYGRKPDFLSERADLVLDEASDTWKLYDIDVRALPDGQDCKDIR